MKEYTTPREAREGVGNYLHFYNHLRRHQALGYRTPAEVYHAKVKRRRSPWPSAVTGSVVLIERKTTVRRRSADEVGNEQTNQGDSI